MQLKKKRYIAAVSGGPDSMALLDQFKKNIVGVCHVNYHKRVDSDYDTQLVKKYCIKHNIPLTIYDVDKKVYKTAKQRNFQTLAREIRYEFFVKCGKKFKCYNLLIAHNLNDFLETATMQANRKSQNFFYGIRQETKYKSLNIFRPLINKFKSDLENYCKSNNIAYAIDSSNASDVYERNRVRKQLNKLSKKQLLFLYKKFQKRNKKFAKIEQEANKILKQWEKTKYSVAFAKKINKNTADSVIYLYLKNSKIDIINYNKIKLVRDYIVSKKSNIQLRLGQQTYLLKKDGKVRIIRHN